MDKFPKDNWIYKEIHKRQKISEGEEKPVNTVKLLGPEEDFHLFVKDVESENNI